MKRRFGLFGLTMSILGFVASFASGYGMMFVVPVASVIFVLAALAFRQKRRGLRLLSDVVIGMPIFCFLLYLVTSILLNETSSSVERSYQADMFSDAAAPSRICMRFEVDPNEPVCWISSDLNKLLVPDEVKRVTAKVRLLYRVGDWNSKTVFTIKYMELLAVDGNPVTDNTSRGAGALDARQEEFGRAPALKWWFW